MNPKATQELAQLPFDEFVPAVSRGLELVIENVTALSADAEALFESGRHRGGRILKAFAEEEAAKILILLDAVRCPTETGADRANLVRQLRAFNDHVPKGIYVEYCDWRPATFEEADRYASRERSTLFINSSDYEAWIERNKILQDREDLIYVSYVKAYGNQYWNSPALYPEFLAKGDCRLSTSTILSLVNAMKRCGFFSDRALREVAAIWRSIRMTNDFHIGDIEKLNRSTLQAVELAGLFSDPSNSDFGVVIDRLFPLYAVDLTAIRVKEAEMEKVRREHEESIIEQLY
jgi:AbiV family abortive infection protein